MPGSRYDTNPVTLDYYQTFKRVPQEKFNAINSFEHTMKFGERFDQLAYKNYGRGTLWWVIAIVNNVGFEFTEVKPGDMIKIPFNPEDVFKLIS